MNINSIFKLFRSKKSEEKVFLLVENAKENYLIIFENIAKILRSGNLNGQAKVVENIAAILVDNDYPKFEKELNSVNMWGGAGAVWEVDLRQELLQKKFNTEMLALIDLMEKTKVLGGGIKPLKRLFRLNTIR